MRVGDFRRALAREKKNASHVCAVDVEDYVQLVIIILGVATTNGRFTPKTITITILASTPM